MNIERPSDLPPSSETTPTLPPTTFQNFLDHHEIPRLKSWWTVTNSPDPYKITDRAKLSDRAAERHAHDV
jgi:hypothetical protein